MTEQDKKELRILLASSRPTAPVWQLEELYNWVVTGPKTIGLKTTVPIKFNEGI